MGAFVAPLLPGILPRMTILPSGPIGHAIELGRHPGTGSGANPCWPKLESGCPDAVVHHSQRPVWTPTMTSSPLERCPIQFSPVAPAAKGRIEFAARAESRVEVACFELAGVVESQRRGGIHSELGAAGRVAQGQVDGLVALEVVTWVDQGDRELAGRHARTERDRAGEGRVLSGRLASSRRRSRNGPRRSPGYRPGERAVMVAVPAFSLYVKFAAANSIEPGPVALA